MLLGRTCENFNAWRILEVVFRLRRACRNGSAENHSMKLRDFGASGIESKSYMWLKIKEKNPTKWRFFVLNLELLSLFALICFFVFGLLFFFRFLFNFFKFSFLALPWWSSCMRWISWKHWRAFWRSVLGYGTKLPAVSSLSLVEGCKGRPLHNNRLGSLGHNQGEFSSSSNTG